MIKKALYFCVSQFDPQNRVEVQLFSDLPPLDFTLETTTMFPVAGLDVFNQTLFPTPETPITLQFVSTTTEPMYTKSLSLKYWK